MTAPSRAATSATSTPAAGTSATVAGALLRRGGLPGSSQPATTRVSWSAPRGSSSISRSKEVRDSRPTRVSRTARTVAVRREPVSRATSPTVEPRPISRTIVSTPSAPATATLSRPPATT